MKRFTDILKKTVFIITFALLSTTLMADPPDPNGGDGNGGGILPGGGAPVGSGVAMLIGLATAYGARKRLFNIDMEDR